MTTTRKAKASTNAKLCCGGVAGDFKRYRNGRWNIGRTEVDQAPQSVLILGPGITIGGGIHEGRGCRTAAAFVLPYGLCKRVRCCVNVQRILVCPGHQAITSPPVARNQKRLARGAYREKSERRHVFI